MKAQKAVEQFDASGKIPEEVVSLGMGLIKEVVLAIIGKRRALRKEIESQKEAIRLLLEVAQKHEEILKKNGLL